jgi:hypothetical protein
MSAQEVRDFVETEINACIALRQRATTAEERREADERAGALLKHRDERIAAAAFFRFVEMKHGPPAGTAESDSE